MKNPAKTAAQSARTPPDEGPSEDPRGEDGGRSFKNEHAGLKWTRIGMFFLWRLKGGGASRL